MDTNPAPPSDAQDGLAGLLWTPVAATVAVLILAAASEAFGGRAWTAGILCGSSLCLWVCIMLPDAPARLRTRLRAILRH